MGDGSYLSYKKFFPSMFDKNSETSPLDPGLFPIEVFFHISCLNRKQGEVDEVISALPWSQEIGVRTSGVAAMSSYLFTDQITVNS